MPQEVDSSLRELAFGLIESESLEDCFQTLVMFLLIFAVDKYVINLTHDSFQTDEVEHSSLFERTLGRM